MFRKILIANRGEIAVRVLRTCREMGIPTVAVYSDVDRAALHVRIADEAVAIGAAAASESYLNIPRILDAARLTGADAVHPGYGFLSENPAFADACDGAGVKFIGPSPEAMRRMGSKTAARELMMQAGVPVVPGTASPLESLAQARDVAEEIGYPIMLKASAGGGGKGMRLVATAADLASSYEQARAEAKAAFSDDAVYIEKAIVAPRHVEVQILADEHGRCIHLGERECSLQRRHQKVVEETPSPLLAGYENVRGELTAAAVRAAQAADYSNAGTVEFLMDAERNFYFLEMNARLQVEHPVTELVTGLDLVKEQILIATGAPLRYAQQDIRFTGSAIECRVYAEDPNNNFFPSPGKIVALEQPHGPNIRVDSGSYVGWTVPLEYDPLIAKLSAWAPTRDEAIAKIQGALREYHIGGIQTTLDFFREILATPEFRAGDLDTGLIDRFIAGRSSPDGLDEQELVAALHAAATHFQRGAARTTPPSRLAESAWRRAARQGAMRS